MSRYRASLAGTITADGVEFARTLTHGYAAGAIPRGPDSTVSARRAINEKVLLSQLATDGNHAREWAELAAELVGLPLRPNVIRLMNLLQDMATYHRESDPSLRTVGR